MFEPHPVPEPRYDDIALLAKKFYLDGNCEAGHDLKNWQCARFMLRQKQLIQLQIKAIHDHRPGGSDILWAS